MEKLFTMTFLCIAVGLSMAAETATVGGYTFKYEVVGGGARILCDSDYQCAISPIPTGSFSLPDKLDGYAVTEIGNNAFSYNDALTSITIPASVRTVGQCAFFYCTELKTVVFEEPTGSMAGLLDINYGAFQRCAKLTSVTLPSTVRNIAGSTFQSCYSLPTISVPASVRSFGDGIFYDCSSLMSVTFLGNAPEFNSGGSSLTFLGTPAELTVYVPRGSSGWNGDSLSTELPSDMMWPPHMGGSARKIVVYGTVDENRWWENFTITSGGDGTWKLADGVYRGDEESFDQMSYLSAKFVGEGLLSFKWKFEHLGGRGKLSVTLDGKDFTQSLITSSSSWREYVSIPVVGAGEHEIRWTYSQDLYSYGSAFIKDVALTPKSDWKEPSYVWQTTSNGNGTVTIVGVSPDPEWDVTIPEKVGGKVVSALGDNLFYDSSDNTRFRRVASVVIPDSVTRIGQSAFEGCENVRSIVLPAGLLEIGRSAFLACHMLESIEFPETLTTLNQWLFGQCWHLKEVDIPANVQSMDENVFCYCYDLSEVRFKGDCPQKVSNDVFGGFSGPTNCTVYVRSDSSGWGVDIPGVWKNMPIDYLKWWSVFELVGGGDVGWRRDGDSYRSGGIAGNQDSTLALRVSGVGTLSFEYAVSSESGYDKFSTLIDGQVVVGEKSGEIAWASCSKFLSGDCAHHVVWKYAKDGSVNSGEDCARIRNVVWSPGYPPNTVTFSAGSHGTITGGIAVQSVAYGEAAEAPTVTANYGYAFIGWDRTFDRVTSGMTVTAQYERTVFTVSFDTGGGSGSVPAAISELKDFDIVLPAPGVLVKYAHVFSGWSDGNMTYAVGQSFKMPAHDVLLTAAWEPLVVAAPVITPQDGTEFRDETCSVSIDCATAGASIFFTTDGTTPRKTSDFAYSGAFTVDGSVNIKAIAVKEGVSSAYSTAAITKWSPTLMDAADAPDLKFETGGIAPWRVEKSMSKIGAMSVRSGQMGAASTAYGVQSWIEVSVSGEGTFTFWWRVDCEHDDSGDCTWDRLMYFVDNETEDARRIDGSTDWAQCTVVFENGGEHKIRWVYYKDRYGDPFEGSDCGWIDGIVWTPMVSDQPIPALGSDADAAAVQAALSGSTDMRLLVNITDAAIYNAYRDWAMKIGAAEVKASPFAWASFATDSATLLAKMPSDDDLKIEEFKPSAMAGSFDFTVSVTDVTIGDKASEENLKKLFGLEGAESLDTAAFLSENVALQFKKPQDGKLKFAATPAVNSTKAFFMKVKVR